MSCRQSQSDEIFEQYVLGRLGESEAEDFENHLVDCEDCQDSVARLLALREAMGNARSETREQDTSPPSHRHWAWLAVAAALILVVGLYLWLAPSGSGSLDPVLLAELAAFEPPPYDAPQLRSSGSKAERLFDQAMERYSDGDYAGAIPDLEASAELDAGDMTTRFFLGVCQLETGAYTDSIGSLGRVVDSGSTPYLARALFYRAKAHIARGELDAARSDLREAVQLGGPIEKQARGLLKEMGGI